MSSRGSNSTRNPSGPQGPGHPQHPDNAFSGAFLDRFGRRDQPPTTEADTAGPWTIRAVEGGYGIYAPATVEPEAVFAEWELALLCAAAFPPSGADERLFFDNSGERPFPVTMAGDRVGWVKWFREDLIHAMNRSLILLRRPASFAYLMEAAGSYTLERAGAILAARLAEREP